MGIISVNWISDKDDSLSRSFLYKINVLAVAQPFFLDQIYTRPLPGNIYDKSYPFIRDIYLISRETFRGLGYGFIQWACAEQGQRIVLKSGLVPATMPIRLVQIKNQKVKRLKKYYLEIYRQLTNTLAKIISTIMKRVMLSPVVFLAVVAGLFTGNRVNAQDLNSAILLTRSEQYEKAAEQFKQLIAKEPGKLFLLRRKYPPGFFLRYYFKLAGCIYQRRQSSI